MQDKNLALSAGRFKGRNYFLCRPEHNNDQTFCAFMRKLVEKKKAKMNLYKQLKETLNGCAHDLQSRFNSLEKVLECFFATSASFAHSTSDAP